MRTFLAFTAAAIAIGTSYGYAEHVIIEEPPIVEEKVLVEPEGPVVVKEISPHHHRHHVEVEEVEVR